jgi:hypothetical protein
MVMEFYEDTFIHHSHDPQAWLEVVASDEPDMN